MQAPESGAVDSCEVTWNEVRGNNGYSAGAALLGCHSNPKGQAQLLWDRDITWDSEPVTFLKAADALQNEIAAKRSTKWCRI
jgi:hypothetical protein